MYMIWDENGELYCIDCGREARICSKLPCRIIKEVGKESRMILKIRGD